LNIFKSEVSKKRAELRRGNREFPKDIMVELPLTDDQKQMGSDGNRRIAAFRNFYFLAQLFETPMPTMLRLSVNRTDIDKAGQWLDRITFDDLYWVKNQCGFQNCDAVEVYPKVDDLVDDHNIRHIFIFIDETFDLPFKWKKPKEQDETGDSGATVPDSGAAAEAPQQDHGANAGGEAQPECGKIVPLPT
jgi:hypothetical protein